MSEIVYLYLVKQNVKFFQGIWDNVRVKKSCLTACNEIATNLLEVDEVMRAGMRDLKGNQQLYQQDLTLNLELVFVNQCNLPNKIYAFYPFLSKKYVTFFPI